MIDGRTKHFKKILKTTQGKVDMNNKETESCFQISSNINVRKIKTDIVKRIIVPLEKFVLNRKTTVVNNKPQNCIKKSKPLLITPLIGIQFML